MSIPDQIKKSHWGVWIVVAVSIIILTAISIPSFVKSRNTANQQALINILNEGERIRQAMARYTNTASSSIKRTEMHYGDEFTGENTPKENSSITAYPATTNEPQSNLLTITLDQVSVYDAIRMSRRISSGTYFTNDSIPKEELEKILVSVNVKNVTEQEYLRQVASSAGLNIEIVNDGLLRVTKKQ
jgi:type II secretory pathway pseudopilin PulG